MGLERIEMAVSVYVRGRINQLLLHFPVILFFHVCLVTLCYDAMASKDCPHDETGGMDRGLRCKSYDFSSGTRPKVISSVKQRLCSNTCKPHDLFTTFPDV